MAAAAGPESRLLGGFRLNEEHDFTLSRAPRGAGRTAVNPRCADAVNERAVHLSVAQRHRGQASLVSMEWVESTWVVHFFPSHNSQNLIRGAIRFLRSKRFFRGTLPAFAPGVEEWHLRGVCIKTTRRG